MTTPTLRPPYFTLSVGALVLTILAIQTCSGSEDDHHTSRSSHEHDNTFAPYQQDHPGQSSGYTFEPGESNFSITFAAKPDIDYIHTPLSTGALVRGQVAELRHNTGSFQRAEFIPLPPEIYSAMDESQAIADMMSYAQAQGLRVGEMRYTQLPWAKYASLRGYKTLIDGTGQSRAATFEMKVFYGARSSMIVYTGGPSNIYPTQDIIRFQRSIRPIDRQGSTNTILPRTRELYGS